MRPLQPPAAVVALALRALTSRGPEEVLDLVSDSDVEAVPTPATRRLRFGPPTCQVDLLVQEPAGRRGAATAAGAAEPVHVLLRVTPPGRRLVRAVVRRQDLAVPVREARTDAAGTARLAAIPRGIASFWLDDGAGGSLRRTAWVRL